MIKINREKSLRRKPIIAANWKMNKTVEESFELVDTMVEHLEVYQDALDIVIIPPFMALYPLTELLEETDVKLGAQNMFYEEQGAYTGEVSPLMLREVCDYVIIGHSERRQYFQETDETVNKKVKAALRHDIKPIIAVGENLEQQEAGQTEFVVTNQVQIALKDISGADASEVVIAYEPLWAIGTGKAATGVAANEVIKLIRRKLSELYDQSVASQVRIQYGGSVTADNIAEFMAQSDIDGALVGGASLKATDFLKIVGKTQEINAKK